MCRRMVYAVSDDGYLIKIHPTTGRVMVRTRARTRTTRACICTDSTHNQCYTTDLLYDEKRRSNVACCMFMPGGRDVHIVRSHDNVRVHFGYLDADWLEFGFADQSASR